MSGDGVSPQNSMDESPTSVAFTPKQPFRSRPVLSCGRNLQLAKLKIVARCAESPLGKCQIPWPTRQGKRLGHGDLQRLPLGLATRREVGPVFFRRPSHASARTAFAPLEGRARTRRLLRSLPLSFCRLGWSDRRRPAPNNALGCLVGQARLRWREHPWHFDQDGLASLRSKYPPIPIGLGAEQILGALARRSNRRWFRRRCA